MSVSLEKAELEKLSQKIEKLNFWGGQSFNITHPRRAKVDLELRVIGTSQVAHVAATAAFPEGKTFFLKDELDAAKINAAYVLMVIINHNDILYWPLTGKEQNLQIISHAVTMTNNFLEAQERRQLT